MLGFCGRFVDGAARCVRPAAAVRFGGRLVDGAARCQAGASALRFRYALTFMRLPQLPASQ